jgi:hypothetical protein
MNTKNTVVGIILLVIILVVGTVVYLYLNNRDVVVVVPPANNASTTPTLEIVGDTTETEVKPVERGDKSVIGTSVNGKEITAFHFGTGDKEILLLGGVHGSYSPNTSGVAEEAVAYFKENPSAIPDSVTLTIIPNLNPDGLAMTGTEGRFNANDVDLNRNFDCEWSKTAVWRSQTVSGGEEAFSEPEARALRDYLDNYNPVAAIVWFSAEGKVYPSACGDEPGNASIKLAETFATASGYGLADEFDAYTITGDMVNWMAKEGIPAISVLLTDHKNTEWAKNKAGIEAVLKTYAENNE